MQDPLVVTVLELLIIVALVAAAVLYIRIPYTVALVLAGLVLSLLPHVPRVELTPNLILTVFLPVLLFHGAYNLDLADVRRQLTPIAFLAIPGVMATAGLVGAALHVLGGLSWVDGILFGTIVAATDPVAVLSIFGEVGAPTRLNTIVTGESLFNDGTALVFFTTTLGIATTRTIHLGLTFEHFAIAVAGALALGAAIGVTGAAILRFIDDALLETTITFIMAYGGYLLADRLGSSGPIETVTAGLLLGARGPAVMSPSTRVKARATWSFLDFLANSLLFLLVGLAMRPIAMITASHYGMGVWRPLLVAILAIIVARIIVVWLVNLLLKRLHRGLPRSWEGIIVWAGLRGGVSLAAALSLPKRLPQHDLLLTLTFAIVLYTLLGQGLTMRGALRRLGIRGAPMRRDLEIAVARLAALRAAEREVRVLQRDDAIDEHLASHLLHGYRAEEARLRAELDAAYHGNRAWERRMEAVTRRRLLDVQREAVRRTYAHDQISAGVLETVEAELDAEESRMELDIQQGEPE